MQFYADGHKEDFMRNVMVLFENALRYLCIHDLPS
jgi:hypothetical protein